MNRSTLKTILKTYLVLIVDHREKDRSIEQKFSYPGTGEIQPRLNAIRIPLTAGDFSFMLLPNEQMSLETPIMFHRDFIIERKSGKQSQGGGFAEMRNNLFKKHDQFKKEFQFPAEHFYLLLENTETDGDLFTCTEYSHTRQLKDKTWKKHTIRNETYYKTYYTFLNHRNEERKKIGLPPIQVIHCKKEESAKKIKELIFEYVFNIVNTGEL